MKRVIRFSLSQCKWTSQKQKQMRNTSFSERLRRSNLYLNCACKSRFLLACGLCLLLIIPVIIPKKTCHFCHVNLFTCGLLLLNSHFFILFPDLTQEVASKGLGLVYEHGDGESKKELVSLLVDTLTNGRRWALNWVNN